MAATVHGEATAVKLGGCSEATQDMSGLAPTYALVSGLVATWCWALKEAVALLLKKRLGIGLAYLLDWLVPPIRLSPCGFGHGRAVCKSGQGTFQLVLAEFDTYPLATQAFGNLSRNAAAGERIDDEVALVRKHSDKKLREFEGEPSWMRFQAMEAAIAQISAVTFGVGEREQVWRNRSAVVDLKVLTDIVTEGRSRGS